MGRDLPIQPWSIFEWIKVRETNIDIEDGSSLCIDKLVSNCRKPKLDRFFAFLSGIHCLQITIRAENEKPLNLIVKILLVKLSRYIQCFESLCNEVISDRDMYHANL